MTGRHEQEARDKFLNERVGPWLYTLGFMVAFLLGAFLIWSRVESQVLALLLIAGLAVGLWGVGIWKIRATVPLVSTIELVGEDERLIDGCLGELRGEGYRVLHDLSRSDGRGDRLNIDHVLVGPAGVFAIETKAVFRPTEGPNEIAYDGETLAVPGVVFDRDPLAEAQTWAEHVAGVLAQFGRADAPVRPVLLFPGWTVKAPPTHATVWVLNPKQLAAFIRREKPVMTAREIGATIDALANRAANVPEV